MSALEDFTSATSLKIVSITAVLRIPTKPDANVRSANVCPDKRGGEARITIMASQFMDIVSGDFPIIFEHPEVIEPGDSRMVVRFSSDQTFNQPLQVRDAPTVQLRTVTGHVTLELRSIAARDENDCSARPKRYAVTLATVTSSLANELLVGVDLFGRQRITAANITLDALAGGERPPAPPEPLRLQVVLSERRSCEIPTPARITGSVIMNRDVTSGDGSVRIAVTSTAGSAAVEVVPPMVQIPTGSRRATFQIPIPASFAGTVTVTAVRGADRRGDALEVVEFDNVFCLAPEMYILPEIFRVLVFPCPELSINVIGEVLGSKDGWGFRQRTNELPIYFRERVGGEVRRAAMNAFGEVAGSSTDISGKLHGFVLPAGESAKAVVLDDVQLTAINDDGLAVGYRRTKDQNTAFAFALARQKSPTAKPKGKAVALELPKASRSEAVAVNNLGQIVVVATFDTPKILLFEKAGSKDIKEREIGDIGELGTVRRLTDSGFLVGNDLVKGQGFRAFLISLNENKGGRIEVPALKGFENAIALDVDERGTVVGRAFNNKGTESRGFRFTSSRGTEDLNGLVKFGKQSGKITAALGSNKRGEILVELAHDDGIGYALLVPKR